MAQQDDNSTNQDRYNLQPKHGKVLQPLSSDVKEDAAASGSDNPAVDLLRERLNALYDEEPSAKEELAEVKAVAPRSKHQKFMYELSNSGKSLAEIQTEWHNYYINLSDDEKHDVWKEFYANHKRIEEARPPQPKHTAEVAPPADKPHPHQEPKAEPRKSDSRSVADIKDQIVHTVSRRSRSSRRSHKSSLKFGLSMGLVMVVILLFGLFNERFIAPLITPSRSVSSTPIIIDPDSTAVGPEPKIIIPKINVEIPVVYDVKSIAEADVQEGLERGVVHYPFTADPGELGNGVIFGHSSNNILNSGKYKFAFVLLNRLENGDTFMVQKDGKRYIYKVYEKKVVAPTDISVLGNKDKPATMTLITCDPPGTSINRLVVVGEQISPDPAGNVANEDKQEIAQPEIIPSNAPSLWQRFTNWLSS